MQQYKQKITALVGCALAVMVLIWWVSGTEDRYDAGVAELQAEVAVEYAEQQAHEIEASDYVWMLRWEAMVERNPEFYPGLIAGVRKAMVDDIVTQQEYNDLRDIVHEGLQKVAEREKAAAKKILKGE